MMKPSPFSMQARIMAAVAAIFALGASCMFLLTRTKLTADIIELEKGFGSEIERLMLVAAQNGFTNYLDEKNEVISRSKNRVRDACESALQGILLFQSLEKDGVLTGEQARSRALAWVKARRFGQEGVQVFVLDESLKALASELPAMEGVSWMGFRNLKDQDAFALARDQAAEQGFASSVYWGPGRPGETPGKRLGAFAYVGGWKWLVGSAVDMEEIERADKILMGKALDEVAGQLRNLRHGERGYAFIAGEDGRVVLHPAFSPGQTPAEINILTGRPLFEDIAKAARTMKQPLLYEWTDPATGQPDRKLAFVEHFKPFGVYIGFTVSLAELTRPADSLAMGHALIASGVLLVGLVALYPVVRSVARPVRMLADKARMLPRGGFAAPRRLAEEIDALSRDVPAEAAALAEGFKFMLTELETHLKELDESRAGLRELNQTLESRIARRTRDLEDLNERLRAESAERLAALEKLETARNMALDASRAKSLFLANMSHEIRTPLTAVLGLAELSLIAKDPAKRDAHLLQIKESTYSLLAIINDILDLSRVEAGKTTLADEPFSLGDALEEAALGARRACREKGLDFEVSIAPGVPGRLCGDRVRLAQVVGNLLGNAVKFTSRGSVRLGVCLAPEPETSGRAKLLFRVEDTGVGVPPEQSGRIFESFHQADAGYSKPFQGAGLGLAICRELTALMGGRIWHEPRDAGGSVFLFMASFGLLDDQERETP
jgi:signal transduction histidine kinase